MFFFLVLVTFPLSTVLWWKLIADRWVRRWPAMRFVVGAIITLNLLYFAHLIGGRMGGQSGMTLWPALHVWGYVWYMVAVPLLVFPWVVTHLAQTGFVAVTSWFARVRNRVDGTPVEPAAPPSATPPAADPGTSDPVTAAAAALLEQNRPLTRRDLFRAAGVAAPIILTAGASARALSNTLHYRIRRLEIPFPDLPAALDGFTIAHLSDLHAGRFIRQDQMEKILESTNALNADLAIMTGDIIDAALADLPPAIEMMKAIRARHGFYLCEGNHDLFESRRGFEDGIVKAGLPLLLNEGATVQVGATRVRLVGLRWGEPSGGGRGGHGANIPLNAEEAFPHAAGGDFPILLAHHPAAFDRAARARIPLTFAGHTHGGQLMLDDTIGAGPIMFDYWSGLYRKSTGAAMVVSNGIGNWMPLRINAPAEIIHITLRRGAIPPPGGQGSPTGARA